ncbi:hypothetical protein AB2B41_04930 [Marimonas sp. MJW-29]|uniref:Uncharacterized protein n=1 Tax=Sulfitobacter sediminis TaxID=3234186 RepID=A0ABV3RK72_9RHOB
MKKSKHPVRMKRIVESATHNDKLNKRIASASQRWQTETKARLNEVRSDTAALSARTSEVNDLIRDFVDIVTQITVKETEWENETDPRKKKKLETDHTRLNKAAEDMIKTLNTRFNPAIDDLIGRLETRSAIAAINY